MKPSIELTYHSLLHEATLGNGIHYCLLKAKDPALHNSIFVDSVITTSIYSHTPVNLSSDDGLFWQPCIALYLDDQVIGYMVFTLNLGVEYLYCSGYKQNLSFELNYIYILPEYRGRSLFSSFIDNFLESFLDNLQSDLTSLGFSNVHLTYLAEYATKEGRNIGNRFEEAFENFSEDNRYDFMELL